MQWGGGICKAPWWSNVLDTALYKQIIPHTFMNYVVEFERQFKFVQIDMLPPPPRFVQGPKTYPSKNAKNPGKFTLY